MSRKGSGKSRSKTCGRRDSGKAARWSKGALLQTRLEGETLRMRVIGEGILKEGSHKCICGARTHVEAFWDNQTGMDEDKEGRQMMF